MSETNYTRQGKIDSSTYEIIGEAYREVARKEPFVVNARNIADVGLLSSLSTRAEEAWNHQEMESSPDTGAARVLLEEHILFDVIDETMDFGSYQLLILPDDVQVNPVLEGKLEEYLASGGKLVLTGESGIDPQRGMLFDVGGDVGEPSPYLHDFVLPRDELQPDFVHKPMVMNVQCRRLKVTDGESIGIVHDPYFNREWDHFCSHQHAPPRPDPSGFDAGSIKGNILYLAHPVFTLYRSLGQVALRQFIGKCIRYHLSDDLRVEFENFPSPARATLTVQSNEGRYVLHLLNANPITRGGDTKLHGGNLAGQVKSYEVIEDVYPIHDIKIRIRFDSTIRQATLEPDSEPIPFRGNSDGSLSLTLPRLDHHQMIVFHRKPVGEP